MLNIYRGRESIDKEKFIYESIRSGEDPGRNPIFRDRTIVIVPDQYTLEAEKQALNRLNEEVLLDVEITGISHLGSNLIKESGLSGNTLINRYGRHMLISRILRKLDDELVAFKGFHGREGFVEAINDFISAAKRSEIGPDAFFMLTEKKDAAIEEGAFLRKLKDLALIYSKYQEEIEGKYTDGEDLLDLYIASAASSKTLPNCKVWIYGFDSFTAKNLSFIMALATTCKEVNIFLTYDRDCRDEDLFVISETATNNFKKRAEELKVSVKVTDIKPDPRWEYLDKAPGIRHLEKELFAVGPRIGEDSKGVEIIECLNPYNEAEAAAAYVLKLLREEKYRLSDIDLICNDQDVRGTIIGHMFKEYGLDVFDDRKRRVMNSPIAIYILSLIEIIAFGYRTTNVIRLMKTGLTGLPEEDLEELENYVWKYDIKGSMWKKPFTRGEHERRYKEGVLASIEETRRKLIEIPESFESIYKESKTYGEFASKYIELLQGAGDDANSLLNKASMLAERQAEAGLLVEAEETLQIWETMVSLLDQIRTIMEGEPFDGKEFAKLFKSGMSQVEVGVLPPTPDDILLGTMQRTRSGDAKAVLVLGANDSILPLIKGEDVLFSKEELQMLTDSGNELGVNTDAMMMEEDLAIYRNLAKPSEHLWISYSTSDVNGDKMMPSAIVEAIKKLFRNFNVQKDPIASENIQNYIGGRINTLRHYTEAQRNHALGKELHPGWAVVGKWLESEDAGSFRQVLETLTYENNQEPLTEMAARDLFASSVKSDGYATYYFSPSSLEKYSRCPFSYFVSYGLRAKELRQDLVGGREIGDLYHSVLQKFTEEITRKVLWEKITREESDALVKQIAEEWAEEYRSNLFGKGKLEEYRFNRGIKACQYVAWVLVEQGRLGSIDESLYEVAFARQFENDDSNGSILLEPIVRELSNGRAYIQGRIDRVDILKGDRVKIIDYKTGNEAFNQKEAEAGFRIQLMLYLEAAQEKERKPAGVFYFLIHEPELTPDTMPGSDEDAKSEIDEKIRDTYKMDGILLADDDVIRDIAGDFEGASSVVKLKKKNDGTIDANSQKRLLSEDQFAELQEAVKKATEQICEDISKGKIPIKPKKSGDTDPCKYCDYTNICRFNTTLRGCEYEEL